jgi:hypothetical protein
MTNNNGWPDPARPGVPMNPERDGWHWVADKDGIGKPWVEYWNGRDSWAPVSATPNFICWHWRYIAPVLTPAEADARVAQARRDALEDCATWHDEVASEYKKEQLLYEAKESWTVAYVFAQGYVINNKRAAAIRALKCEGND